MPEATSSSTVNRDQQSGPVNAVQLLSGAGRARQLEDIGVDANTFGLDSISEMQERQAALDAKANGDVKQHRYAALEAAGYAIPKPYAGKPKHAPFKTDDFQIGSVRLSQPPVSVNVDRVRDVRVSQVLREGSLASKDGVGVVSIQVLLEFPYPEMIQEELRPLIAELKTCPFTKLRNLDIAVKLSSLGSFDVDEDIQDATINANAFNDASANIYKLFALYVQLAVSDSGAQVPVQEWQDQLAILIQTTISSVAEAPPTDPKKFGEEAYVRLRNLIETALPGIIANFGAGRAAAISKDFGFGTTTQEFNSHRQKTFGELIVKLTDASRKQREINSNAITNAGLLPTLDGFVPVVCQQVVLTNIPNAAGAFRVQLDFEYFYSSAYVPKMQYHSYKNGFVNEPGTWMYTDDPAEADLLLRWRDFQYLNENSELGSEARQAQLNPWAQLSRTALNHVPDGEFNRPRTPGFVEFMRRARYQRPCGNFPSDPRQHTLRVFYPRNVPQIPKHAQGQNTGALYNEVTIEDASPYSRGIIEQVRVVWNLNIARQVDEHGGLVRHQSVGGSTLQVNFDLCVPVDAEMYKPGISDDQFKDLDNTELGHVRMIAQLNRMFSVMEQNRKILPSDAFMPTTVFVKSPITALFGAYTFELQDIPMVQNEPGCIKTSIRLVESIPVVGLGQARTTVESADSSIKPEEESLLFSYPGFRFAPLVILASRPEGKLARSILGDVLTNAYHEKRRRENPSDTTTPTQDEARDIWRPIYGLDRPETEEELLGLAQQFQQRVFGDLTRSIGGLTDVLFVQALLEAAANSGDPTRYVNEFLHTYSIFSGDATPNGILELMFKVSNLGIEQSERTIARQLYPDMQLPTYAQILGVSPDDIVPEELLLSFMPSLRETGQLDTRGLSDDRPSRRLSDLVDPDIYFRRFTSTLDEIQQRALGNRPEAAPRANFATKVVLPHDVEPGDDRGRIKTAGLTEGVAQVISTKMGRDPLENSKDWSTLEGHLTPGDRRMLFAFPTYALEFYLDITHAKTDASGSVMPGSETHYEARLINALPITNIEAFLDAAELPNIANVEFVARRAGLRNESWHFLPPRTPSDSERFVNDAAMVKQHLLENTTFGSDAMLLTTRLLAPGSRVMLRLGYGTDLNNTRMLPPIISGTIAEMALGEMSRMVIQSFGTQLINPLTATIGGSGRYSPNRLLTGSHTMAAFMDIFSSLETRYLGRSGRGLDLDLASLSKAEIERLLVLGYSTRSTFGELLHRHATDGPFRDILNAAAKLFDKFAGNDAMYQIDKAYLDPVNNIYPEMLNVIGPVSGIGDWAISNTSTKGLKGTYWLDMLSKLNPGTVWWPHTYGEEVRLFWGRPEAVFKAEPTSIPTDVLAYMTALSRNILRTNARSIFDIVRAAHEERMIQSGFITTRQTKRILKKAHEPQRVEYNEFGQARIIPAKPPEVEVVEETVPVSTIPAGYLLELSNPSDTRSLEQYIDNLRAQGMNDESIAEVMRKLLVAKIRDWNRARALLSDVADARGKYDRPINRESTAAITKAFAKSRNVLYDAFAGSQSSIISENVDYFKEAGLVPEDSQAFNLPGALDRSSLNTFLSVIENDATFAVVFLDSQAFIETMLSIERASLTNEIPEGQTRAGGNAPTSVSVISDRQLELLTTVNKLSVKVEGGSFTFDALRYLQLKFLIERTIEDMNVLYKDGASQLLRDDVVPSAAYAGKSGSAIIRLLRLSGYRRFRNYHYVVSGQKLLQSHIEASQEYMSNAVSVDGYTIGYSVLPEERRVYNLGPELETLNFGIFEMFKGLMSANDRDRVIEILFPAALARGLSKMYAGELVLTGDPWIKPHDVIYTLDLHNGTYGPVKANTVIHQLNVQTGLTTRVRPVMLTQSFSSDVLTNHVVEQRTLKSIAGLMVVVGAGAALLGGAAGLVAGGALGIGAGLIAGGGVLLDMYGRLSLNNISNIDPFLQAAANTQDTKDFINSLMLETYMPSSNLHVSGQAKDSAALIQRIRDAKGMDIPQLGVSAFPLMRIGTNTPIIAGMRTNGLLSLTQQSLATVLREAANLTTYPIERTVADVKLIIGNEWDNFQRGWKQLSETIKARAETTNRVRALLRSKNVELPQ